MNERRRERSDEGSGTESLYETLTNDDCYNKQAGGSRMETELLLNCSQMKSLRVQIQMTPRLKRVICLEQEMKGRRSESTGMMMCARSAIIGAGARIT